MSSKDKPSNVTKTGKMTLPGKEYSIYGIKINKKIHDLLKIVLILSSVALWILTFFKSVRTVIDFFFTAILIGTLPNAMQLSTLPDLVFFIVLSAFVSISFKLLKSEKVKYI